MRHLLTALLLLGAAPALAAPAESPAAEEKDGFKLIKVAELAKQLHAKDSKVVVYDANFADFRKQWGVIPGAKMLPGLEYDASAVLPEDKGVPLVFYCANTH